MAKITFEFPATGELEKQKRMLDKLTRIMIENLNKDFDVENNNVRATFKRQIWDWFFEIQKEMTSLADELEIDLGHTVLDVFLETKGRIFAQTFFELQKEWWIETKVLKEHVYLRLCLI